METRVMGLDELDFAYGVAHHKEHCRRLITDNGFTTICEIGGGRAPLVSHEEASTMGLDYTVLDISDKELRADPANETVFRAARIPGRGVPALLRDRLPGGHHAPGMARFDVHPLRGQPPQRAVHLIRLARVAQAAGLSLAAGRGAPG